MAKIALMCMAMVIGTSAVDPDKSMEMGTPEKNVGTVASMKNYDAAVKALDIEAVMTDITALLTTSQDWWPADNGNYGPFFIRLAWHCSGTYRDSDGRGGCAGGRQRFEPERSWPDNQNLDKARALLAPLKEKYGDALSWGDLFILAGTTAIKSMGGPVEPPCVGRIDEPDGTASLGLGPNKYQENTAPCEVNGQCEGPLGSTTVGLIYLNPEGPVEKGFQSALQTVQTKPDEYASNPDPKKTAATVRDAFGRMGFSVEETLALIAGGHAFGKAHGACKEGTGPAPHWTGNCGTGSGADTFTSGFEGTWTNTPTQWSNQFWEDLVKYKDDWEVHVGPGGKHQWRVKDATGDAAKIFRLTSDVALLHDDEFLGLANKWAEDAKGAGDAFSKVWFKLTTDGGRWSKNAKCLDGGSPSFMLADDMTIPQQKPATENSAGAINLAACSLSGFVGMVIMGAAMRFTRSRKPVGLADMESLE